MIVMQYQQRWHVSPSALKQGQRTFIPSFSGFPLYVRPPLPHCPRTHHEQCFNNRKQSATVFHRRLTLVPARCRRVSGVPASQPVGCREASTRASLLVSLSSSQEGSEARPPSSHIPDSCTYNRKLSAMLSHPTRRLIDRAFITETTHLRNSISPLFFFFLQSQGFCQKRGWK